MLAALIVGALTAWFLGMRPGLIAAAATFVALIVAGFVPGLTLAVYALVIAWSGALYFLGPKMLGQAGTTSQPGGWIGGPVGQASLWARKILRRKS